MKFQEDITSWLKANCCCHTQKKEVALYLITLIYYIYYCNLGEDHRDDNQRITAQDLTVLCSAQPLQNKQQQSRIWNIKAKNGSSYKHAISFWFLTGSNSKCISDSFHFLAGWFLNVSLPLPHPSLLTLISRTQYFCPSVNLMCLIDRWLVLSALKCP